MTMITNTSTCKVSCAPKRKGFLARIMSWNRLWVERQTLKTLDPHLLNDIGVTEKAARREAGRPSWDAPDQWMR